MYPSSDPSSTFCSFILQIWQPQSGQTSCDLWRTLKGDLDPGWEPLTQSNTGAKGNSKPVVLVIQLDSHS